MSGQGSLSHAGIYALPYCLVPSSPTYTNFKSKTVYYTELVGLILFGMNLCYVRNGELGARTIALSFLQ